MIKKVIVSGGWSYGNLGDEVIAKCTIGLINQKFPSAKIIYTSYDINDFFKHHKLKAVESVHCLVEKKGTIILNNIMSVDWKQYGLEQYYSLFDNETLFIMSGGGYFDGNWESQFLARILEVEIAKTAGAKVAIIGQSIGPFVNNDQIELAKTALKKCDFINVRDKDTQKFISKLIPKKDINCTCDIALTIRDFYPVLLSEKKDKRVCNLILQIYARYVFNGIQKMRNRNYERIIKRITLRLYRYNYAWSKMIKCILKTGFFKCQIVLNVQDTQKIGNKHFIKFAQKMKKDISSEEIEIISQMTVNEFCNVLANADVIISCKMHPLIVSASYGVRTFALSQHYKIDAFMEWIGRQDVCFKNDKFNPQKIVEFITKEDEAFEFKSCQLVEKRKQEIYEMVEYLADTIDGTV